jgi:rhodanese-related sulfurtransferase
MQTSAASTTPEQLASLRQLGQRPAILDVSAPGEYHAGHIEGACLVPLGEIDPQTLRRIIGRPGAGRYETLYLTCHSGVLARQAADRLLRAGYYNLAVVAGGTQAWDQAGLPMVRRRPAATLDRQVQIALGTLLILPVVLGFTVHELFFAAVPLIGAGLLLAGVTRWSGMARLLALMPWNRPRPGLGQSPA